MIPIIGYSSSGMNTFSVGGCGFGNPYQQCAWGFYFAATLQRSYCKIKAGRPALRFVET